MLVLTGGIFAGSSGPGRPQPLGSRVSRSAGHGRAPGGSENGEKMSEKSDLPNFFWGVVCTHFNAFRAAIQKMIFFCTGALRVPLPPGARRFSNLAIFRDREIREIREIRENPTSKKIFFLVVYTHFNAFRAAIQKMKKNLHRGP